MNEIESISKEVMSIPEEARLIIVKNPILLAKANAFFLVIRGLRDKINLTFDPIISKAHETHKEAIAQKKKVEEPLVIAESWLNGQITHYKIEQDRILKEEEERLRQKAVEEEMARRKLEEDQRLAEAAALETMGAKDQAEQIMAEILQVNEAPVIVQTPQVAISRVELKGMAMQTNWKFEIISEGLIPREYLTPDLTKIGGVVRALKDKTNIPGVRVYPETKSKSTGRVKL